jgi:hypothetical protein
LAERHGFSEDAVAHMLLAVAAGNGAMAQFNHPEFGGYGQWMQGGMLMLSDMFDHALRARVDALCSELGRILSDQPGVIRSGSFQSQSQSTGPAGQHQRDAGVAGASSLFSDERSACWWPEGLGTPTATGSQDGLNYAYFADAGRLAVRLGGQVRVYDTLDHRIGGFSQQQGPAGSVLFTSQHGTVDLSRLPLVWAAQPGGATGGQQRARPADSSAEPPASPGSSPSAPAAAAPGGAGSAGSAQEALDAIERLGRLRADGLITDEEFQRKKAELLQRI